MNKRKEFIIIFIDQFYKKSQRKRRSSKNQAQYIARTINNVCKLFFNKKLNFTEEEIYKAFELNGYSLMESGEKEFTWERFYEGNILIVCDLFINVNTQSNHDLKLVMKHTYPDFYKTETVNKINSKKEELKLFWQENKAIIEN